MYVSEDIAVAYRAHWVVAVPAFDSRLAPGPDAGLSPDRILICVTRRTIRSHQWCHASRIYRCNKVP